MDITTATATGTALASVLSFALTQVTKKYVPSEWRQLFAAVVSVVLAVAALALTGGFTSGATVPALIAAVYGTSTALYAVVNKALSGKLSAVDTTAAYVHDTPLRKP